MSLEENTREMRQRVARGAEAISGGDRLQRGVSGLLDGSDRVVRLAAPAWIRSILCVGGLGLTILVALSASTVSSSGASDPGEPASTPGPQLAEPAAAHLVPGQDGQTLYDPGLNVTWLADANLPAKQSFGVPGINKSGSMAYETAVNWVRAMNAYDHGRGYLAHNDWMLPATPSRDPSCQSFNRRGGGSFGYGCRGSALGALYHGALALREPDTAVPIQDGRAGPFSNFQPYLYWTDTLAARARQGYVTFSFNTGWQGANIPKHNMYVLPMIQGNPFGTAARNGRGLHAGADGKTVYDSAADITWLADANLAATQRFGITGIARDGSMTAETAASWIAAMNKTRWLGRNDWALPHAVRCGKGFNCDASPLGRLYYIGLGLRPGEPVVATPDTSVSGFHDLQPYLYWACAAESLHGPCVGAPAPRFAWSFSFGNGFQGTDLTRNNLYVMVYHPGKPSR